MLNDCPSEALKYRVSLSRVIHIYLPMYLQQSLFSTRTNSITILLLFCFLFRVAKGGLHSVWQGARAKGGASKV